MGPPVDPPIGLHLTRVERAVSRAFDDALAAADGSRPVWLVLIALKTQPAANQRRLAEAVGIQGATLTHHLNAMEADGLVTERGEATFHRLRRAAMGFDRRLRHGLSAGEVATLAALLERLRVNATEQDGEVAAPEGAVEVPARAVLSPGP